jgi:hypothetical protein
LRNIVTRSLGFGLAGALAVMGAGAAVAQAAQQFNEDLPAQALVGEPAIDPCNGEPIVYTGTVHLAEEIVSNPAGDFKIIAHTNLEDTHGTDATGTKYELVNASHLGSDLVSNGADVYSGIVRFQVISDGGTANYYQDQLLHETITPDGQITANFYTVDTGCTS